MKAGEIHIVIPIEVRGTKQVSADAAEITLRADWENARVEVKRP